MVTCGCERHLHAADEEALRAGIVDLLGSPMQLVVEAAEVKSRSM
jgi:hypothetical protein